MARWARGSTIVRAGELGNVSEADCLRIERSAEFQQFLAAQKLEADRWGELSAKEMRELANEEIDFLYRAEIAKQMEADLPGQTFGLSLFARYLGYESTQALLDAWDWTHQSDALAGPVQTSWDKANAERVLGLTWGEIRRREKRREAQRSAQTSARTTPRRPASHTRAAPARRYKTRTSWGQRVGMVFGYAFYAVLVVVAVGVVGLVAAIVISSFT